MKQFILFFTTLFCAFLIVGCGKKTPTVIIEEEAPAPDMAVSVVESPAPPEAEKPVLATPPIPETAQKLKGYWRRPDGGYMITITSLAENGAVTAEYHNPNPIHVARAAWTAMEDDKIGLFIELRDRNYDGATYRLVYDRETDTLAGVYFQPALQQEFKIFFERINQ